TSELAGEHVAQTLGTRLGAAPDADARTHTHHQRVSAAGDGLGTGGGRGSLLGTRSFAPSRPASTKPSRMSGPINVQGGGAEEGLPAIREMTALRGLERPLHAPRGPDREAHTWGVERKLATVLFVDLVGSTALVAGFDPEVARRRVTQFFGVVSGTIAAHGGTVEKFAGDAVMAAFGVPRAHEDDAERALRAALEIRTAVGELGVQCRIGIEAGEVVIGHVDSTFATGQAVNAAARLQQLAEPDEVLVGAAAHRLAAHAVRFGATGEAYLDWFAAPVRRSGGHGRAWEGGR